MVATSARPETVSVTPEYPTLLWGPVFAGWFVANGVAGVLYLFGLAVGFSAFNPYRAMSASGISGGAVVWLILTWGAALWIGSMFASWFDGSNDTEMGVVRGLTVWGLAVTTTGLLIASGHANFLFLISPAAVGVGEVEAATSAHNTAAAMWTAFGSATLALLTSLFGGWMGAHHVHRVYHLRRYMPHVHHP